MGALTQGCQTNGGTSGHRLRNRPARYNAKWVYDEILAQAQSLTSALDARKQINIASATLDADLASFVREADTPAGIIVGVSVLAAEKRQAIIKFATDHKVPGQFIQIGSTP